MTMDYWLMREMLRLLQVLIWMQNCESFEKTLDEETLSAECKLEYELLTWIGLDLPTKTSPIPVGWSVQVPGVITMLFFPIFSAPETATLPSFATSGTAEMNKTPSGY